MCLIRTSWKPQNVPFKKLSPLRGGIYTVLFGLGKVCQLTENHFLVNPDYNQLCTCILKEGYEKGSDSKNIFRE